MIEKEKLNHALDALVHIGKMLMRVKDKFAQQGVALDMVDQDADGLAEAIEILSRLKAVSEAVTDG